MPAPILQPEALGSEGDVGDEEDVLGDPEMAAAPSKSLRSSLQLKGEGRSVRLSSDFFSSTTSDKFGSEASHMTRMDYAQAVVIQAMRSMYTDIFLGGVILFNFTIICIETDLRAEEGGLARSKGTVPTWLYVSSDCCFAVFCIELLLRMFAERRQWRKDGWNLFDAAIVFTGLVEYAVLILQIELSSVLSLIRALRLFRLLRLWRLMRSWSCLQELRFMIQMIVACAKAVLCSFIVLFFVLTMWAIVAVELIHPRMEPIAAAGQWKDCERCSRGFSSVLQANLTFFMTVVAGDSWGTIAVPVIEQHPWTAIIFCGSLMTIVFGMLNLIIAVMVDTFAASRENDVATRALDMEAQEQSEKKILSRIFDKIDQDRSGSLSLEELQEAARTVPDFAHWLRVLDIAQRDLELLFDLLDEDQSGEIDAGEFIEAMFRFKHTDPKTNTRLVKNMLCRMDMDVRAMRQNSDNVSMAGGQAVRELDSAASIDRALKTLLTEQDGFLQRSIEVAVRNASDVALEASLQAASVAAREVMSTVASSSDSFAEGLRWRMLRQRSPGGPLHEKNRQPRSPHSSSCAVSDPLASPNPSPQPLGTRLSKFLPPRQPLSQSMSVDSLDASSEVVDCVVIVAGCSGNAGDLGDAGNGATRAPPRVPPQPLRASGLGLPKEHALMTPQPR